jgi:hypothetical protein
MGLQMLDKKMLTKRGGAKAAAIATAMPWEAAIGQAMGVQRPA